MKLYTTRYSPSVRRVTMFMAEKALCGIETIMLDLRSGDHRAESFQRFSPLSHVPTLVLDDGRALTESRAICGFLEGSHPNPNLMGRETFERAEIEMWDRRVELGLAIPIMNWVRHGHPIMRDLEPQQNLSLSRHFERQARQMAQWFDTLLRERPWIAGDRFTVADITAVCGLDYGKMMKWRPDATLPNLARWRARIADRPSGSVAP